MLKVEIILKDCWDCRHRSHSGAFTTGGAKDVCDHQDACICVGEFKTLEGDKKYDWKYRVVKPNRIPNWCPLKQGKLY